ncbi:MULTISPECIES: DNA polymerase IV [Oceanobacillus]|uniref:DNA polymerase IV n=1 Tax=Oceanobacillus TaxID=182709 RepID=UPI00034901BE|nr:MULTISPECIES: DNA polymerase IV [Oceanobacillus]MBT2598902.1 DNA polymerase IV [Oceanobacillus sp. ISL-74]MBT2651821.1 DNA polymerase IV [Oceanobacillus sp. ISL-73]MCT1576470.1 DNA polymerase IV [Oceanobacillus kimchii]MCT2136106.1 DNA polymerase IV [Oceanobacillus kimchii]OEH54477.1 UV damage repair protein UvrX [Oceanobacillus sp. E9]
MDYSSYPRNDVLCIDMRSFYASVEAVKLNLDPMKVMLAVVGDPNRSGSIVLAASPELKRRYGISNVSRFFELPDDPEIHIVPAHMADYIHMSLQITDLLQQYAPLEAIHPYSVDEVWITVNGLQHLFGTREEIAKKIKADILDSFGITCSIGIGDNKFLAKVVMDLHAKKQGIAECTYEDVEEKLWPHPIESIWGIGGRMKRNLNRMGIITLGQLANYNLDHLKKRFGVMGEQLYWHAWGIDLSPVFGDFSKQEQKGFGHGISLLRDYTKEDIPYCILDLCEEVCRRARTANKSGRTIHLGISYSKETGGGFSRSQSIDLPTNITLDVYDICMQLFNKFYDGKSMVRHVYVTLTNLRDKQETQLDLFEDRTKKNDIGYVMDAIRDKYGSTSILRASSYTQAGITIERSKKIGGHYA